MTSGNELVELPADGPATAGPPVRGCVGGRTRALTIPAAGKSCGSGSTPIGWAQDGRPGPAGAAGWPQVLTGAGYDFNSPDSVTATGGQLWVTNTKGNSLTEISDTDGALVRRIAGRQYGFSAPVAATTNGNRLWVANLDGDSVTEINASDGSVVRVISGAKYGFDQPVALTYESGDVWVVNAVGNSVTELSAADGSLVRVISTAGEFSRPVAIAGDGTDLWVANSGGNSVTELSGSNGSLVRTLSSGDNFGAPDSVAVSAGHLWVANKSNCTVSELNTSDGSLVHSQEICSGPVDGSPEGIIADAAHVWITVRAPGVLNEADGVTELDATDGTFVRRISDDGDGFSFVSPFPAGLTEAGGHVWVANPGAKTVTKLPQAGPAAVPAPAIHACVNSSTRAVTVPASGSGCPAAATAITWNQPGPAGAGIDPDLEPVFSGTHYQFNNPQALASDGSHLFIANAGGNSLTEVNVSDGSLVGIVQGPGYAFSQPEAMVFNGTDLWVANAGGNSVTEIDPSNGNLVRVIQGPSFAFSQPNALVFDGSHLWVASSAGNSLTEINAGDGSLVRVVSGSGYAFSSPSSLAFDGSNIWVSNSGGSSITELSAADGSLVRTISGGNYQLDNPGALVFDGGRIWVANGSNDDEVTVINASDGSLAGVVPLVCGGEQLTVDGSRVLAACGGVTELQLGTDFARTLGDADDLGVVAPRAIVVAGGHVWEASSVPDPNLSVASLAELPLG
jgi:DNA-binding beta-propeller fold protein YncE